jgi:hypothetical protein
MEQQKSPEEGNYDNLMQGTEDLGSVSYGLRSKLLPARNMRMQIIVCRVVQV